MLFKMPSFFTSTFDLPNIFAKASNSFSSITRSTITMALLMSPPRIRLSLYIASSSWRKQKVRHEAISFSNCSKEVMEAWLVSNTRRIIIDHHRHAIIVERKGGDFYVARSVFVENGILHLKKIPQGILLFLPRRLQYFYKLNRTAVHDRRFGPVELNEQVVDFQPYARRHGMFNGADARAALLNGGAARNIYYIVAIGVDDGGAGKVYPLKFYAVIGIGRKESHRGGYACVQTHS